MIPVLLASVALLLADLPASFYHRYPPAVKSCMAASFPGDAAHFVDVAATIDVPDFVLSNRSGASRLQHIQDLEQSLAGYTAGLNAMLKPAVLRALPGDGAARLRRSARPIVVLLAKYHDQLESDARRARTSDSVDPDSAAHYAALDRLARIDEAAYLAVNLPICGEHGSAYGK
jgi:hypothetical protein